MAFTRYHLGSQASALGTAASIMNALVALFAVANDVDTAASVSGVLTWTRDSTAGSEALYSNAFGPRNCRIIIAVHDSGSPPSGPNMSVDTYAAARVLVGLASNASGAYTNWYDATAPFSGADFDGYYLLCATSTTMTFRAMLSSKDLFLQATNTTGVQTCHLGAIIRGATGYQESDGYRYGQMVSGVGDQSNIWRSDVGVSAGFFGKHGTSSGFAHCGVWEVGTSTWQTATVASLAFPAPTADWCKFDASTAALVSIPMCKQAAPLYELGSWLSVYESALGLTAQNVSGSASTYVRFSSSVITTDEQSVLVARTVA